MVQTLRCNHDTHRGQPQSRPALTPDFCRWYIRSMTPTCSSWVIARQDTTPRGIHTRLEANPGGYLMTNKPPTLYLRRCGLQGTDSCTSTQRAHSQPVSQHLNTEWCTTTNCLQLLCCSANQDHAPREQHALPSLQNIGQMSRPGTNLCASVRVAESDAKTSPCPLVGKFQIALQRTCAQSTRARQTQSARRRTTTN